MADFVVLPGDCVEVMRSSLEADSIDAIVCDPPYGLEFMGKDWDKIEQEWHHAWAAEALRVAKPGAYLLAFGGTRTFHRLACAIEDAGWELRDTIMWVYGSGFPKSLDVSKAIDKAAGAEREVVAYDASRARPSRTYASGAIGNIGGNGRASDRTDNGATRTAPATDDARRWEGWGTALKPAYEPIIVARKPLARTVAANVLAYGTGAMNIDGCRVPTDESLTTHSRGKGYDGPAFGRMNALPTRQQPGQALGRWPANLIHDGSDEVVELFPSNAGAAAPASGRTLCDGNTSNSRGKYAGLPEDREACFHGDSGSAARFFYCAKASKADREEGCEALPERKSSSMSGRRDADNMGAAKIDNDVTERFVTSRRNHHPTVKPTDLMRYLCRLVTQPGGLILDPFCGSGSTGKAALLEGFDFIGIEREDAYREIAEARLTRTKGEE